MANIAQAVLRPALKPRSPSRIKRIIQAWSHPIEVLLRVVVLPKERNAPFPLFEYAAMPNHCSDRRVLHAEPPLSLDISKLFAITAP